MPAIRATNTSPLICRHQLKSPLGYSTDCRIANTSRRRHEAADLSFESTLSLFVLCIRANNAYYAITLDDFTVTTDFLHGSTNFHCYSPFYPTLSTVAFKVSFFKHRVILIRHHMSLYLCHKVHDDNHDNQ